VLGFAVGDSEDGAFWTPFLRSLKARGLTGTQLVISDAHAGLQAAIEHRLLGAAGNAHLLTSTSTGGSRRSPPPPGEDLGSVTFEVQRQTCPSRRWRAQYWPVGVVPRAPR
jgi:hypothetical protein